MIIAGKATFSHCEAALSGEPAARITATLTRAMRQMVVELAPIATAIDHAQVCGFCLHSLKMMPAFGSFCQGGLHELWVMKAKAKASMVIGPS